MISIESRNLELMCHVINDILKETVVVKLVDREFADKIVNDGECSLEVYNETKDGVHTIFISNDCPVNELPNIICREVSHISAGYQVDDSKFQDMYNLIQKRYEKLVKLPISDFVSGTLFTKDELKETMKPFCNYYKNMTLCCNGGLLSFVDHINCNQPHEKSRLLKRYKGFIDEMDRNSKK